MTTDIPEITSSKKKKKVDSSMPKWTVFSIFFITTLIVVSLIKVYIPLLVTGLAMMFVWSQMTKPVAEIETQATNDDNNQLNLFHRKYKIGRKYSKIKEVLEEEEDHRAA